MRIQHKLQGRPNRCHVLGQHRPRPRPIVDATFRIRGDQRHNSLTWLYLTARPWSGLGSSMTWSLSSPNSTQYSLAGESGTIRLGIESAFRELSELSRFQDGNKAEHCHHASVCGLAQTERGVRRSLEPGVCGGDGMDDGDESRERRLGIVIGGGGPGH